MRVLVTGATGFIGRRLVEQLLERGDDVWALTRQPLRALPLRKRGVRVLGGDITRPQTLPHALVEVEVVYHAAALVALGIIRPALHLANVTGTANLLAAARAAGVQRFVHVSSCSGYLHPGPQTTEEAPIGQGRRRGGYGASKARGDLLAQAAMGVGNMEVSIVRPTFVFDDGTASTDTRRTLQFLARLPIIPLPAGGALALDIVHAADVAQLLIRCGTLPQAANRAYNASGDEGLTLRQLVEALRPPGRRPPRIMPLPTYARLSATYPATRAREELGYTPQHRWIEAR